MPTAGQQSLNLLSKEAKSPERNQVERAAKRGQRKVTSPQVRQLSTTTAR